MEQIKKMASNSELKELIKLVADSEILISDLSDGFSFSELGDVIEFAKDLPPVLSVTAMLFPQYRDLDAAGQADLIAYAKANCKFPKNMEVEVWVQKVLSAVVFLSSVISALTK